MTAPAKLPARMTPLERSELHASLSAPVLGALGFLNEVMDRFPQAISFAPGAPFRDFFDDIDVAAHLERFRVYLREEKGFSTAQADKLLYQYGPSQGIINELVAAALRSDEGIAIEPCELVITAGCQEAMLLALRALCATNADRVAVASPCFVGLTGAARLLDIALLPVDERADGIDLDMLRTLCVSERATGRRVRALYVAPDFSNPSGTLYSHAARVALLALAEEQDFLLLEDNAYGFTTDQAQALPSLMALDTTGRVLYLGTCAKMCFPGLRVGFVAAPQRVRDGGAERPLAVELATLKSMVTVNTSPLCQAIVAGMLLEHGLSFKRLCRDKSTFYRRNLQRLLAALECHVGPGLGVPVQWNRPQGGFFVRMRLPIAADEALLQRSAEEYGVIWTPMRNFSVNGRLENELRLSCSYLRPEEIDEGVRRLGRFLRDVLGATAAGEPAWA